AVAPQDAPDADELREELSEQGPRAAASDETRHWFRIDDPASWASGDDREARERDLERLRENPAAYFAANRSMVAAEYGTDIYLLLWDTPERSITSRDPGWQLTRAMSSQDQQGFPAVGFELNTVGASYMGRLTSENLQQPMAIVLDGRVYSAPNINSQIRGSGIITGRFSAPELEYLIRTLQAGALQATLSEEPISVRTVGPTLGQDNLERGLRTSIYALIIVAVFMMIYYFFAGMVANMALFANIVIILGMMSTIQAAFTLPGIAGVVLTIGMCVDANVLIFERIREELRRGADMPTSLRLGYQKALSAIVDGNLTNLIICFVLGFTATAEVRGFAVTLGIGIVATLFTSVFMTRIIFDAYYRAFGAKQMSMLPTLVPGIDRVLTPAIRWVAKRRVYFGVSTALIVVSILLIGARGVDLLDIEFRGGTEVTFDMTEGERLSLPEVRERLDATDLPDYTAVPLGSVDDAYRAESFSILTTLSETEQVTGIVQSAFEDVLDVQPSVQFAGMETESAADAPLYPVDETNLGQVINEPAVEDDVSDHIGGVAIVLRDLSPSLTIGQIEDRINNMRLQPDYETLQFRPPSQVVGLRPDPENPGQYVEAVVISSDPNVRYSDDPTQWEQVVASTEWNLVRDALTRETSLSKVSNFTPTVARTMAQAAIIAVLISLIAIVAYIWFRFGSLRYSLAAIAALVHDVVITVGLVAASAYIFNLSEPLAQFFLIDPFKINMGMIAALLTIIGYSLNDTIVIFDRIRENRGKLAFATPAIINDSINQTISRTLITSGTTLLAVVMLYIFGGSGIHAFAFALVVGIMVGTYSSIAIAASLLLFGIDVKDDPPAAELASPAEAKPVGR
ncbi:MAG: protein translocase subunit SecD, partial [Phycisphaeraceae bacterium]